MTVFTSPVSFAVRVMATTGVCTVVWAVAPRLVAAGHVFAGLTPDVQSALVRSFVLVVGLGVITTRAINFSATAIRAGRTTDGVHDRSPAALKLGVLPDRLRAIHEAGHAVVMAGFGWTVTSVDIVPTGVTGGIARGDPPPVTDGVTLAWERLVMKVAGTTAERLAGLESLGGLDDISRALDLALFIIAVGATPPGVECSLTVDGLIGAARDAAETILSDRRATVNVIAEALLADQRLDQTRLSVLLAAPDPQPVGGAAT